MRVQSNALLAVLSILFFCSKKMALSKKTCPGKILKKEVSRLGILVNLIV